MNVYTHLITHEKDILKYFYENNICFLDIETTGLSRKHSHIYLIGLVYLNKKSNSWCLTQFFANHIDKEKELLEKFNDFICKFDLIVTYNGDSFDLPFIKYRSKNHNIKSKILKINSFDIYREIKNNTSYLHLKNLKLKTVEESLGIYREDEYSGKDCISFYYQYMKTKEEVLKQRILKHNYDDLYYLLDVIKIFDFIKDIKSIMVNFSDEKIDIEVKDIMIDGDVLKILCNTSAINNHISTIYYEEGFNINWQDNNILTIELEIKEGLITPTKKCIFINKITLPSPMNLEDLSQYVAPDNIILLKVEDKYEMKNIKNIIKHLVQYILLK